MQNCKIFLCTENLSDSYLLTQISGQPQKTRNWATFQWPSFCLYSLSLLLREAKQNSLNSIVAQKGQLPKKKPFQCLNLHKRFQSCTTLVAE